jgi:hypothetical protein
MSDILKEILKKIPEDRISSAGFEGANIVLYTKDEDFFLDNRGVIKEIVDELKKRIELRPDPSIVMDLEKAEKEIRKIIPEEAGISNINFDTQRSRVIIEAEKPGLAIGKEGEVLRTIRAKTLWVPLIRRTPALRSKIIEGIRAVLYKESTYRRKFLDKVGHRIYDGWLREKKEEWVRISFLGGARQVGRSCLFLQTPESRVLLDCGVNVALPYDNKEAYPYLEVPEFNIKELDAVIISHAHLDHIGFLPYLFKFGYSGPIYMTSPTRDVGALLLMDFIKIMKSEGRDPIFDTEHVKEMVKHTICLDYEEVSDITPDVRITLYNAGHILGSSIVHLHIANGLHNIVYTGDFKFGRTALLEPANTQFPRVETLIMESTYGGKDNVLPPQQEADEMLKKIIIDTVARKGKILMPTLGSGRSQEIMLMIESMVKNGELEKIPVYIDGMVWDITAIHTAYPEYLNSNVRRQIFHKDENPFLADIFKEVGSKKERMEIIEYKGPCVIIATSGMMVGGPSVEYFKHLAENPNNSLVFTCYQGEGSLGRRIQGGEKQITFSEGQKQEVIEVKMEVHKLEITAHSDRKQLMNYAYKCFPKPKKIIVCHGENSRCLDLASSLHKMNRVETAAPRNLEVIRVK